MEVYVFSGDRKKLKTLGFYFRKNDSGIFYQNKQFYGITLRVRGGMIIHNGSISLEYQALVIDYIINNNNVGPLYLSKENNKILTKSEYDSLKKYFDDKYTLAQEASENGDDSLYKKYFIEVISNKSMLNAERISETVSEDILALNTLGIIKINY